MPAVQDLPFSQNFAGWAANSTTYPNGFQGWVANTSGNTGVYNTGLSGDRIIIGSSNATQTSGNIHNYNGMIGFLNTTSVDLALGLAFSTSSSKDIKVEYDAMVFRNQYDGTTVNRLQEMSLQYRIGITGAFTTLPGTAYSNNSTVARTAANLPDPVATRFAVILPAECNYQPIIQIRWIAKLISGSAGGRQSFAIDNIDIKSDDKAPVNATGYPKTGNVLTESFDYIHKINEIGKTYYVLLPSGSAAPTIAQIKAGQDASGTAALQSGIFDVTDFNKEYVKTFAGLSINTPYSVFYVSEDIIGNISTVNKLDASTAPVLIPSLAPTVASLDLGFSEVGYDSEIFSYQIAATNLTNDVVVSSPANFTISKDNNMFASSLTFAAADFALNATPTVYVKFTPNAAGNFTDSITHETVGGTTKTVSLTALGVNPFVQNFDDVNIFVNSKWLQYNEAGPINKWSHTTQSRNVNSGIGAVLMNGFSDSGASKDWLISPRLRLDSFSQIPLLSFYSRKYYYGPSLKLMVSTNYDGVSDPNTATWIPLDGKFPDATGTYVKSQYINLTAYKTDHTYLAWVYETTAGGSGKAAEWSLDDFAVTNVSQYVDSNPILDFADVSPNSVSVSQSFVFKAAGYGDITIEAPASYQLSSDNISFASSIIVSSADALAGKTVYARFVPTTKEPTISGVLTITGTSLNKQIGSFTGSSILKADTFDVVTYNLEFFGSDVKDKSNKEFGPTNDALQIENVAKVMNKLNADVYVVQEVSDDPSIDILISKININGKTFDKTTSTSWSYSFQAADPYFPPQKLVVLYNTQTTTVKKTRVMFEEFYKDLRDGKKSLTNYPVAVTNPPAENPSASFFSSGRLPYMVTIETNIGGVKKEINLVDLHARANSGSDISKYNMRKYDAQVLKDSLDAHYPNSNLIILGDFNDDVKASVIAGQVSSYESFVNDNVNYNPLTLEISKAGAYSFLSSGGFLDHIVISNELTDQYIDKSIAVYDPRADITDYTTTTSDHGPVIARFELKKDVLSTVDFETNKGYLVNAYPNPSSDVVNIEVKTKDDKNLTLNLYDITGRSVIKPIQIKGTQEKNAAIIQLSNLRNGIYFYTLSENNKVIYSNKIVKK
ncbi:T9SS-dependent choice-of-anchor J family protein [Flavobacterium sp. N2038]|uniref:T9SS-dependent choice-of-anchor J family protein n=1 Tax=Flavobacterium sp. N2038 TaxID=2986829 RepID=UPI002224BA10|nr:choice-of-anchor J domain-containing protein [Flavobacterium sp. N2038]